MGPQKKQSECSYGLTISIHAHDNEINNYEIMANLEPVRHLV